MPISTHKKQYLFKLLGESLDDEKLEKYLNELGMSVERFDDETVDVEYQANRPDLVSTVGLARALKYFTDKKRGFQYATAPAKEGYEIHVGNAVEIRPYIAGMLVESLHFDSDSFLDLINSMEKLTETFGRHRKKIAVGLHDAAQVKPPLYYDTYKDEKFLALGAEKEMNYSSILKTTEKGKAYGDLCKSNTGYLALEDTEGTMALIPVINSERTKITEQTSSVFVDVTGTTKYIVEKTADLIAANFIDMGSKVYRVRIIRKNAKRYETPQMKTEPIKIPLQSIRDTLGVWIEFNNAITLANKMGYRAALVGRNIRFEVPAYRLDVINDQDVTEDIAIAYGYDYIQPLHVFSSQQGALSKEEILNDTLREIMTGLGFYDTVSSYMTNEETNFTKMNLETKGQYQYIKIKNAKASTITMMRTWVLPSLMESLGKSQHDKFPQKIFEIDKAFEVEKGMPKESYHIAAAISGPKVDLNEIKNTLATLAKTLNSSLKIKTTAHGSFIEGRCGAVEIEGKAKGVFGELHPQVLSNFGIEEPVVAFDIQLADDYAEK